MRDALFPLFMIDYRLMFVVFSKVAKNTFVVFSPTNDRVHIVLSIKRKLLHNKALYKAIYTNNSDGF